MLQINYTSIKKIKKSVVLEIPIIFTLSVYGFTYLWFAIFSPVCCFIIYNSWMRLGSENAWLWLLGKGT